MKHSPGFLQLVESIRPHIKEIEPGDVVKRLESGELSHFIDVREESEWAAGHLPLATHLGKGIIERDIEAQIPNKNAPIVLYCGGGFRSALAADNLQKMGYTNVTSMIGGYRGWMDGQFPMTLKSKK